MRAVVRTGHGTLDRLSFRRDWPVPRPGPGQALIEIGACGLNNTDVNTRTAWYSTGVSGATTGDALEDAGDTDAAWGGKAIAFPRIQGADVCGRVVALCAGCDASLLSRRVLVDPWLRDWSDPLNREQCGYFGSECDGGFADYTVADVRNVHVVDSDLADAELATFPTMPDRPVASTDQNARRGCWSSRVPRVLVPISSASLTLVVSSTLPNPASTRASPASASSE